MDEPFELIKGKKVFADQVEFTGRQSAHIADPSNGATVDAEARTAINAILVVLEKLGFTKSA